MALVDGLGGEELGQVGSQVSSLWMTGSLVTQSDVQVAGNVSGAGNAQWGASVSGTKFNATTFHGTNVSGTNIVVVGEGKLRSTSVDNATQLEGYKVKAGSVLIGEGTSADNSGCVTFKTPFADANWYMTLTPRAISDAYLHAADGSRFPAMVSGVRRASGCWVWAGSNTVVDWIAVGM